MLELGKMFLTQANRLNHFGWETSHQTLYFQMPEGSQNTGHAILDGLYELHDTVGTGGFAKVKVATHIQTGLKVGEMFSSEKI